MSNNSYFGQVHSKSRKIRLLFMISLLLVSCLFLIKFDLRLSNTFIYNILNPLTEKNESNTSFVTTMRNNTTKDIITNGNNTAQMINMYTNSTNISTNIENSSLFEQPKEAFVTFCDNNPTYLALLRVLLDSIHAFSTRPIIAFGINVELDVDTKEYPRLIKRRISQYDCGPSVYFCKLHAVVSSNVEYGVLMETDDVVNYNVDILFDVLHVWPYPVPLSPRHPDDPQNYYGFMREMNVSKRTTPYMHAHMIWNYHAMPFLRKLQTLLRRGHFQGANFDETAVNVMLWHAGADHTLCKYDPYFSYSDAYERWPIVTNCSQYCHTVFLTLHGNKEVNISSNLLERLKTMKGKPTVQTPGMGGFYHINDKKVTCCYPDSEPSSIHPLLCKHRLD